MTFIMICKRPECRNEYEANRSDIMRGSAWWSLCPACRLADAAELPSINLEESDTTLRNDVPLVAMTLEVT